MLYCKKLINNKNNELILFTDLNIIIINLSTELIIKGKDSSISLYNLYLFFYMDFVLFYPIFLFFY